MALASTVSCHTKLFVYQHLRPNVSLSLRSLRPYYSPPGSPDLDCLRGSCAYSTFYPASRVYTSEVPLFRALISRCPLVKDAAEADLFIVPSMLATIATCFWGLNKTQGAALKAQGAQGQQLTRALYDQLPHLSSQTARRHVFFWTVDADWVSPDGQVGVPPELSGPMHDAIYIHLGDDHYRGPAWHRLKGIKGGRYMTRDVVVPYRITQWLPFGFPPPRLPARLLINANVNLHRHAVRRSFGKALDVAARARGIRWRVMLPQAGRNQSVDDKVAGSMLDDVRQASNDTLSSTFCLCPTGDAKGLTARFYHSIVHGCIPVRVDGWRRNLTVVPYHNLSARTRPGSVALPFASLIAWEDVIIDADPAQPERLLDTLLAISDDEIVARKAYLARIAPLMLLEEPPDHQGPDHEPQGEFSREGGRAKGSSQAWRGATRAREVGGRASIAPNGVDAFIRELQHVSSGTRPGNH